MPRVLTFDLGTTNFKAAIFDTEGRLESLARRPTPTRSPQSAWHEIPVDAFGSVIAALVDDLRTTAPAALDAVQLITFATQTNTFALLDHNDTPLTPFIVWTDRRAESLTPEVQALSASPAFQERTGVSQWSAGFMAAKLIWLSRNDPRVFRHGLQVRLISDYLTQWFTGAHFTEAGAAGLTGLLDIHRLTWRCDAIGAIGVAKHDFPTPVRAGRIVGPILPAVARKLGLPADARFVVGCLDQYAGAIGAGNVAPGIVSETTGTVLATVTLADHLPKPTPAVFYGPAWQPGLYWRMCFGDISANLLEAFAHDQPDAADFDALTAEADAAPLDTLRLDADASAAARQPIFLPTSNAHPTRGEQVRAILTGVAEALHQQVRTLNPDTTPTRVVSVGGAARSDLWLRIKADALGVPVERIDCPEPTCLGAALLAAASAESKPLAGYVASRIKVLDRFTPRQPLNA